MRTAYLQPIDAISVFSIGTRNTVPSPSLGKITCSNCFEHLSPLC